MLFFWVRMAWMLQPYAWDARFDLTSLSQAQAELETIDQGLIIRYPTTDKGYGVRIERVLDTEVGDYSATLWLVAAAVACLFLIGAANIVNLILARTLDRRKEAAVRRCSYLPLVYTRCWLIR